MRRKTPFEFLTYLAESAKEDKKNGNNHDRIPPLTELSKEKGVSIASLREQLGVARALGLVEVRPRTGIRRLPYTFSPAVSESLDYAIQVDRKYFDNFSDLRKHIEADYWHEAVQLLTKEDKQYLVELVDQAWEKLHGSPIQLVHNEHRQLHVTIFRRLDNPFVIGIMEAYWDAYEKVGLNRYEDLAYLKSVWQFHRRIVDAICNEEYKQGFNLLLEHMDLIGHRYIA
ncbi:MAG: FCD domain-containing protein [Chloroflexota bacterium]